MPDKQNINHSLQDFVYTPTSDPDNPQPPLNDGNQMFDGRHWVHLQEWLQQEYPQFRLLIKQGAALTKTDTIYWSIQHASDEIRGRVADCTVDAPAKIPYVRSNTIATDIAAKPTEADYSEAALPRGVIISAPHLSDLNNSLFEVICKTYADLEKRKEFKDTYGANGLELLRSRAAATTLGEDESLAVEQAQLHFLRNGLANLDSKSASKVFVEVEG